MANHEFPNRSPIGRLTGQLDLLMHALRPKGAARPWTVPLATGDLPQLEPGSDRYSPRSWVIRLQGDLTLEIVLRPSQRLDGSRDRALADMHRLLRHNSDFHPGQFLFRHLDDSSYCLCVLRQANRPKAFMTTRELPAFRGRRVLMLGTTCVDRSVARQRWSRLLSVFPVLLMLLRRPWASIYVVARTASPRVLGIMASLFDGYPRPLHETPADLLDVGVHVAEATCPGATYDREAMILRDVLANDPGAQIGEQYRDPLYNAYCADLLGPTDSFVLTSRLGLGKLCRALWRHVLRPTRRTVKDA